MNMTEEKITEIKAAADIVEIVGEFVPLKQQGKDYAGLCPFHPEKTPSFTVSPGKQMYFCFGCNASGDVFEFLQKNQGLSFIDAAKHLAGKYGINLPENAGPPVAHHGTPKPPKSKGQGPGVRDQVSGDSKKSSIIDQQSELWQEKAGGMAAWAHEKLLENPAQLKKLADRGINLETVKHFRLGYNPGKDGKDLFRPREAWGLPTEMKADRKKKLWIPIGLVIPMFNQPINNQQSTINNPEVQRLRIRRPDGSKPSYYVIPGSSMATWVMRKSNRVYVIIESELDGILLWQEAPKNTGVIPLGSASTRPDPSATKLMEQSALILNALDYDTAGAKAFQFWEETFPQSKRWPVPTGKDPGEAWQAGINLKEWITSGFPQGWKVCSPGLRRVGQSSSGGKKKMQKVLKNNEGEAAGMSMSSGDNKVQTQGSTGSLPANKQPAVIPDVYKLEKLLKQYPVKIIASERRVQIKEAMSWVKNNWDVSKKISDLVFMVPEVFEYICEHPAGVITGDNLII